MNLFLLSIMDVIISHYVEKKKENVISVKLIDIISIFGAVIMHCMENSW